MKILSNSFILLAFAACLLTSCGKKTKSASCYDEDLKQSFAAKSCIQDCPGVVGCDGKNYCNECIANSEGIRVK